MLNVVFKSRFKKDLKRLKSSNRDEGELLAVIALLANEEPLD
jgi:mRNA-degrading endonuclease YafQ of YafQ-DinJ toxin-antitoxin module